ncbi:hypothetical protein AAG906_007732 [Vitis piasezkii]
MPRSFGIFRSKYNKNKPRSQAPPSRWWSSGKGPLSGCEVPKPPSITVKRDQRNGLSATGEINDQVESPRGFLLESPTLTNTPPGLHGTHRFFVTIGESNSLVEEARMCVWLSDSTSGLGPAGRDSHLRMSRDSVAVPTYSMDPRDEFRRSMEEMVRSRLEQNLAVDWDYLVELVMCYVELNEREARKYILKAFVDLIVPLRHIQGEIPAKSRRNRCRMRLPGFVA